MVVVVVDVVGKEIKARNNKIEHNTKSLSNYV